MPCLCATGTRHPFEKGLAENLVFALESKLYGANPFTFLIVSSHRTVTFAVTVRSSGSKYRSGVRVRSGVPSKP